jgi:Predicted ATPase
MAALTMERRWPQSTSRISELRVDIEYERKSGWRTGPASLALDIVDYPGEWLLDLALLEADYAEWSRQTVEASRRRDRSALAAPWHTVLAGLDPAGAPDELLAAKASEAFKAYLSALRSSEEAVATTPPGRFLMPGDLAGSPALTFAPLDLPPAQGPAPGSFAALMERRFEAYKTHVVKPFFRDHFQRIDRQIVLVDVLAAIDAGPVALAELEEALDQVLMAFRIGRNTFLSRLFSPRADRVLFAATKADHIHHTDHDRLDAILRLLVNRAARRTEAAGARVGTVALASVRATRETTIREGRETLRAVAGVPEAGERVGDEIFDGETEAAIFPGELPETAEEVFQGAVPPGSLRFPRFRPPKLPVDAAGRMAKMPHIRLDRALEFLLGDRFA